MGKLNMTNELKIKYVNLSDLKMNEYNPKQMTKKEAADLRKSIVEFGIVDPLIVNDAKGREGIIIGGHQRFCIYKELDYKEVPVVFVNIPDMKKEQELCLRLSKNTGEWDFDMLANFDEALLIDVGFDKDELDFVMQKDWKDESDSQDGKQEKEIICPKCGFTGKSCLFEKSANV